LMLVPARVWDISSGIGPCFPLAGGLCKFYANVRGKQPIQRQLLFVQYKQQANPPLLSIHNYTPHVLAPIAASAAINSNLNIYYFDVCTVKQFRVYLSAFRECRFGKNTHGSHYGFASCFLYAWIYEKPCSVLTPLYEVLLLLSFRQNRLLHRLPLVTGKQVPLLKGQ
jgi:hypothetical protein